MARGTGWSNEATQALIALWGETKVQEQLDAVARNKSIYEDIAEEMKKAGYDYTWKQCRTKGKNLAQKYRKVVLCRRTASKIIYIKTGKR